MVLGVTVDAGEEIPEPRRRMGDLECLEQTAVRETDGNRVALRADIDADTQLQSLGVQHRSLLPPGWSKRLSFPTVTDPAAPPFRPERHIPHSIATLRRRIARALAQTLQRCPCCAQKIPPRQNHSVIL